MSSVQQSTQAPPRQVSVEELQAAQAAVAALAEEVKLKAEQQHQQWLRRVRTEQIEPLLDVLHTAAQAHRTLAAAAALNEPAALSRGDFQQRLTRYRAAVCEQVIAVLALRLQENAPGDQIATGFVDYLQSLALAAQGTPDELVLPEPSGMYQAQPQDSFVMRQRKAFKRLRRGAVLAAGQASKGVRRVMGQSPPQSAERGRHVQLRHMLDYHLVARVPQAAMPSYEAYQQRVALQVAALEDAVAGWADRVLAVEQQVDLPAFHAPSDLSWQESVLTGGEAGGEQGPPQDLPREALRQAQDLSARLQEALDKAASAEIVLSEEEQSREAHEEAYEDLLWDLEHAGTFLLSLKDRRIPARREQVALVVRASRKAWNEWYGQVANRLNLTCHAVRLRDRWSDLEDQLFARVAAEALQPVLDTFAFLIDRFQHGRNEASTACEAAAASGDTGDAVEKLGRIREALDQHVREALAKGPGLIASLDALTASAAPEETAFVEYVRGLPTGINLHPVGAGQQDKVLPGLQRHEIDLPPLVLDAIMPPLSDRLEERASKLRVQVMHVWSEAEQVHYIVQYNLGAAIDELVNRPASMPQAAGESASAGSEGRETAAGAALELASEGLARAGDRLAELAATLRPPWQAFMESAHNAIQRDWSDFYLRIQSGEGAEGAWLEFRTRSERQLEQGWHQSKSRARELESNVRKMFLQGRRQAEALVQRGQTAVGVMGVSEEERLRTVDAIVQAKALHARMPLVYRKLFAFEPLTEPSLLVGRTADIARIQRQYERWLSMQPAGATVIPMPMGSGRTSLLNVLQRTAFSSARVVRITLEERLRTPEELAACFSQALGLGTESSLDDLESRLIAQPRASMPVVCLIDNLEHLMLRTPGGTRLLERALIFFSRTDTRIFWVAAMGTYAWRYAEKTAGGASGLVATAPASALDQATLEQLIMMRHRSSGMPLRFLEPPEMSPILRQRLRRAKTPEERQRTLHDDYFARLFRATGQNIGLALFYWLRSVDFTAEEGTLVVHPVRPLTFGFIHELDASRAFTLQAFLQHNTLSLEEHDEIFRTSDEQSTFIMESLLNMHLIEAVAPASRAGRAIDQTRIHHGERYRLSPLMLHPVRELLRSRNMVQ